jgi:hypothetical protein
MHLGDVFFSLYTPFILSLAANFLLLHQKWILLRYLFEAAALLTRSWEWTARALKTPLAPEIVESLFPTMVRGAPKLCGTLFTRNVAFVFDQKL